MELSTTELFDLGVAFGSFSLGDIDQAIHMILPCTDSDTGEESNAVFKDLFVRFESIQDDVEDFTTIGELYMNEIVAWAKSHNIGIGR